MKKIMMMLIMVFSLSTMYAFTGEEAVNKQALKSFKSEFPAATEANWSAGSNYYRVSFTMNDQKLFAFYSIDGDFLSICRNIASVNLPLGLQISLKKSYSDYWISDLFEMAKEEGTSYYVTLENADSKIILKSEGNDWTVYNKTRKI